MDTIKIQNKDIQLTDNFNMLEFFSPTLTKPGLEFPLFKCIPDALQIFRYYFKVGWIVSSVYRPTEPLNMPSAHRIPPPACDSYAVSDWTNIMSTIEDEMKNWRNSKLIQDVLGTGCNVVIIEGICLHIHYRTEYNNHPDDTKYPSGIYLGSWFAKPEPNGTNIIYSI